MCPDENMAPPSGKVVVFNYIFPPEWSQTEVVRWLWRKKARTELMYRAAVGGWYAPQYNQGRFECDTVSARTLSGGEVVAMFGRALVVTMIVFLGAACAGVDYYREVHHNSTRYSVVTSQRTPGGIRVDPGGNNVSHAKIDRYTNELEECLGVPIRRNAFVVKFPTNIYISKCSGAQLFPCAADPRVCRRKIESGVPLLPDSPCTADEIPCPQCPCACRGAVQNNWAIVVTPDMILYKATLATLILEKSAVEVWSDSEIIKCIRS